MNKDIEAVLDVQYTQNIAKDKKEDMVNTDAIEVEFVYPDASTKVCKAEVGDTLLNVIRNNDIPIPCSCGGALACSTCHVVLDEEVFDKLENDDKEASDDEEDLLEVASGRKDTSRLGCQVTLEKYMNGMKIEIPK